MSCEGGSQQEVSLICTPRIAPSTLDPHGTLCRDSRCRDADIYADADRRRKVLDRKPWWLGGGGGMEQWRFPPETAAHRITDGNDRPEKYCPRKRSEPSIPDTDYGDLGRRTACVDSTQFGRSSFDRGGRNCSSRPNLQPRANSQSHR